jgi:hypothetical protein
LAAGAPGKASANEKGSSSTKEAAATAKGAGAPGKAPANEEGSSSKKAAAATVKGAVQAQTAEPRRRLQPRPRALRRQRLPSDNDSEDYHDDADSSGWSSASSDDEDSHDDGDDKTTYTPPSRERMEALVKKHVHRPPVPVLVGLMQLRGWKAAIRDMMSPESMAEAGTGLACLDKGMAYKKRGPGCRIIRRFVCNEKGVFDDKVLKDRSPWLFDFIQTLMEEKGFTNVALQKMTAQEWHCDPHAKSAPAGELHVLLTVDGADHSLGLSSSKYMQSLAQSYRVWEEGSAAVKLKEEDIDNVLLVPRPRDGLPLQAVDQELFAGLDLDFEHQTRRKGETLNRIVPVHAGVTGSYKSDSNSLDPFWRTASEFAQLRLSRELEFKKDGVVVSTTLLANMKDTAEEAARAVECACLWKTAGCVGW